MDTSEGAPPAGGLKAALARLAESVVGLFRTRAELAGLELVEERERLVLRLALLVGGIVVLAFAALFVGGFIIAWFWDSHRLLAIAFVALVHALAGGFMIAKSKAIGRDAPAPFSATLAEVEKDRVRLQRAAQDLTGGEP
jgi:uncharacterized membrane protein YqjE